MRGMSFFGVRGMESGLKLACKTVSKEQFYLLCATPPPSQRCSSAAQLVPVPT